MAAPAARAGLHAAQFLCELAHVEPFHLELQRRERQAEVPCRPRDVPAVLLERPQDEVPLEVSAGVVEEAFGGLRLRIELSEEKLERQALLGQAFLLAYPHEPLQQVLERPD